MAAISGGFPRMLPARDPSNQLGYRPDWYGYHPALGVSFRADVWLA
ncbi:MAG: hypothetical protein WBA43_06630 [Elainellaceae cyanobacterium]